MTNSKSVPVVSKEVLLPFIIITSLFALWGFANDITNPMVAAFGTVMEISTAKAALVQLAFYGGYATMAIPAALFVRKYSYKKGILLGLTLYAIGQMDIFKSVCKQEMYLVASRDFDAQKVFELAKTYNNGRSRSKATNHRF